MIDTLKLLETRRSAPVPLLGSPGPSLDQLEQLLRLASRVPDHGKLAPWRFILFTGEERHHASALIAEVYQSENPGADEKRLEIERRRFSAPVVIGVVSRAAGNLKIPEWEQVLSAGAVCMTLVVAANAMGFATSWLTEWYAYNRTVLDQFGLAPHEKIAGFIHVGTASEPREDRPRPAIADIVTTFQG
jgi:nitroreductase